MTMKISDFASSVTPYEAGEQPTGKKFVKLNTNENPYPPAPKVKDVLCGFDVSRLRLYPSIAAGELREAIAAKEGVEKDNIFIGNGSDEVLSLCFRTFFDPHSAPVLMPKVTYSFYPVFCALYGIEIERIDNESDFTVRAEKLVGGQGCVIANPNAPTSLSLSAESIEKLVRDSGNKPVIVDEAYIDFALKTESSVGLLKKYENLVVVKTFSKSYSLAGMRCGYAVAPKAAVAALERVRDCFNSYPVDSVCQAVCKVAVENEAYHRECVEKIRFTRDAVIAELKKKGRNVLPSDTNFLLVSGGEKDYVALKDRGVLVRFFKGTETHGYTRVTVGSDEEMEIYLKNLPK